ncbi:MAG: uroporphyrinogen decarboxylase family protein [Eubacteriales bacterium]|jgi:hypothetical protein
MYNDVIRTLVQGQIGPKRPSKETLNHREIIQYVSGIDPLENTKDAFRIAYEKLGIDIVNRVPEKVCRPPLAIGETRVYDDTYKVSGLGVYDTYSRYRYPFEDPDELLEMEHVPFDYSRLITPVPHRMDREVIAHKQQLLGPVGLYYYMYYTTLFMGGVEELGWEIYMMAAALDEVRFREVFLDSVFEEAKKAVELLCQVDNPFVFLHDDLANAKGPAFNPAWYEKYIYPRYQELFSMIHQQGKQVIFVADGNMTELMGDLLHCGIDGAMIETPATPLEYQMQMLGGKILIGGIDTKLLTNGTAEQVKEHTREVCEMTREYTKFVLCASGGLHGNIPLENLKAYFAVREKYGFT